jgi:hypothetical protein
MSNLSDLDNLYKTAIITLPKEERLAYCRQRLDKLQRLLERNSSVLHPQQKSMIKEMIQAMQVEISKLEF